MRLGIILFSPNFLITHQCCIKTFVKLFPYGTQITHRKLFSITSITNFSQSCTLIRTQDELNEQSYNTVKNYMGVLGGIYLLVECKPHLAASDQVLSESRAQQAGQHLLHAGSELQEQELPPSSSLHALLNDTRLCLSAGLTGVHDTLWQTRQDLIQVIWKNNEEQKSGMRTSLLKLKIKFITCGIKFFDIQI